MDANPGDTVRWTGPDGATFDGVLMPSSNANAQNIVVIKLDNGYNIGLDGTNATIELLEAGKEASISSSVPSEKEGLPTVAILGTGGTIASLVDYRTGGVRPATRPEELAQAAPAIFDVCNVRAEVVLNMFSEDMQPDDWTTIAERAAWHLNNGAHGVVIPHGTDTMGYTAAALAFSLKNLSGPVVLVGSQRSSDRPSSDASMNLLAAARVAAETDIGEVVVCMHATSDDDKVAIHRGTRVRKNHTSRRDAFQSVNALPIGMVGSDIALTGDYATAQDGETIVDDAWDEEVSMITSYPGLWPEHLDDVVRKGTILVGTGLGHIAQRCLPGVERAIARGAHVAMASQCIHGAVNMNVYSTGRDLAAMGVMSSHDMIPEVAYVKMMWILGHTHDPDEVRRLFATPLAGEMGGAVDLRAFGGTA